MGKNGGSMEEYREIGEVRRSIDGEGIGDFLVVWEVGSSMGKYSRVGKCRGRKGESEERCGER